MSRQVDHYAKLSKDSKPSCRQYHVKYSELGKVIHSIHDYDKSLKHTISLEVLGKHGEPENMDKPIVDRPRFSRTCFIDLVRQSLKDKFTKPTPYPDRFTYLNITDSWSKIPRTSSVQLEKQLSRDQMIIYKKKQFAPDYHPNFEFGKKQLGRCGAAFDELEKRKDIMIKIQPYNHETYFEYHIYSKDPNSKLFRNPTAPNFKQMLDREQDGKSLFPSQVIIILDLQKIFEYSRMGNTHLHKKMLEVNNFRDGRFQTATSSFLLSKAFKKGHSWMNQVKRLNRWKNNDDLNFCIIILNEQGSNFFKNYLKLIINQQINNYLNPFQYVNICLFYKVFRLFDVFTYLNYNGIVQLFIQIKFLNKAL